MDNKIKEVVNKQEQLPKGERKSFAAFVLKEFESKERWPDLFKKSDSVLTNLANENLAVFRSQK